MTRRTVLLLVPQVLLFGGMTVMLIVHPNAFTSALHSTRALAVNAALLAGWLLLSLVIVPRVIKNASWDAVLLSVVAIGAVFVLVVTTRRAPRRSTASRTGTRSSRSRRSTSSRGRTTG